MSTNIGVTLTADDQQLLAILRSVEGKLDHLAASANGSLGQAGNAAARAAAQVKGLEQQTGMSARAMNAAMRGVPAQFTDIFTSLQGGQAPLTVLLQQGGQLKDMFGGIVPAARALGTYVLGLVNPFTLAAAAVGTLVYGFIAGREESARAARALIETGNAAGVTASQLGSLASEVERTTGATQSKAAEVINMMVRAGVKGSESLRDFTKAAIEMERAGGQSVEETAKAFAALAKNPLEASRSLNESSAYLTTTIYAQIKALQEQGRTVEAAALAQKAYADEQAARVPQMEAQLGTLQKLWRGVTDSIAGARDVLLSIGREDGTEQAIEKAKRLLEVSRNGIYSRDKVPERTAELQALERGAGYEAMSAYQSGVIAEQRKAGVKWLDESNSYLSRQKKLETEIAKVRNEGAAAGVAQEEVNRRIALLQDRADPGVNLQKVRDAEAQKLEVLRRSQLEIDRQRAMGALNERGQIEATTAITLQGISIRRAAVAAELAIVSKKQDSEREAAALQGQIALLDQERLTAQKKGRDDLSVSIYKQKMAIDAVIRSQRDEIRQEQADYFVAESKAREQASLAAYEYSKSVAGTGAYLDLELSMLGATQKDRDKAIAKMRIEIALREKLAAIDKAFGSDPAGDIDRQKVREAAAREIAQVESRAYLSEWQKTWDSLTDGLTDAIMTAFGNGKQGVADFKKVIERTLKNIYIKPMVDNAVKSILGSVQGFLAQAFQSARGQSFVGSSTSGGGLNDLLSLLGIGKIDVGAYASNAAVYTGNAYGTAFGSQQSSMLAAQEAGMSSSAGASSAAAAGGWAALAAAGVMASISDYKKGWNRSGLDNGLNQNINWAINPVYGGLIKPLEKLGLISEKWADILGGDTAIARMFGRKPAEVTSQGITGTIGGASGTDIKSFQEWFSKGGWFRSDKSGTNIGNVDPQMADTFAAHAKSLRDASAEYGKVLGLPVDALDGITTSIRVAFTGKAEEDQKAVEAEFQKYQDALFGVYAGAVAPFRKMGEDVIATVKRLADIQNFSRDLNDLGGVFSRISALGFDARDGFIAMAGGIDSLRAQAKSFVENYYSRDEVAGVKAREIKDALAGVGITGDISTRDQFRALVEGVNVSTEDGRRQLATLLQAQGSFADVATYLEEVGGSLGSLAQNAPALGAVGGILSAPEQAQLDAINNVTGAVNEVRDAIIELGGQMGNAPQTFPSSDWEVTPPQWSPGNSDGP